MKKIITKIILLIVVFGFSSQYTPVNAQGMMGRFTSPNPLVATTSSTTKDESDGKAIYELLQSKEKSCKDLTDEDFDVLGDYYMGQRLGNTATHDAMNTMMKNMMGEEGEKQMHITLGKRLSGCSADAPLPPQGVNFLPMMGLGGMMNNGSVNNNWGTRGSMMSFNSPSSFLSSVVSILIIIFLILGIVYLWKEIARKQRRE